MQGAARAIGTVAEPRADSARGDPAPRDAPRRARGSWNQSSVPDADRHHRAGVDRRLDRLAPLLRDVLLPDEHVVVAEVEHVGRRDDALAVALTEVHVHVDLHVLLLSAMRSASSSGMASATWRVLAETAICSPAAVRSTSQSTTVFSRRPRPLISTATASPGSIGRELAGVPDRTTSPGSSVISRHRSASW